MWPMKLLVPDFLTEGLFPAIPLSACCPKYFFNEVLTNSLRKFFCSLTGLIVSILPSLNFATADFVSNYFPLSLVYYASFKYLLAVIISPFLAVCQPS